MTAEAPLAANAERHGLKSETREMSFSYKRKCVGTWATEQLQSPSRLLQARRAVSKNAQTTLSLQEDGPQRMVRSSPQLFHHGPG